MIQIRAAKFKELETIVDFQCKMALETEDFSLDKEVVFNGVERIFEDSAKGQYFVAIDKEERVKACLLITPEWSDWRNGTVYWIQSVYVLAEYRSKGVFKQMYAFLKDVVEQDDSLMGLRLYVEKENVSAQKVYDAMGMSKEHYQMYEWMKTF